MRQALSSDTTFTPITKWGGWLHTLVQCSDSELAQRNIAELNLTCAAELPECNERLIGPCLAKVDDWSSLVDEFTCHVFPQFAKDPYKFGDSEARFRCVAMSHCLQKHVGIKYNLRFSEGEYDASNSRNLFIHGILTGFGGTCVSLPVLYCALGRRLGYPLKVAETSSHAFCRWDDPKGETFCFDAAGRGCTFRDEDYYRHWPKRITPNEARKNGYIRCMTTREELAFFAATRGNCLFDNFNFVPAVEAFYLAHKIAPHKFCLLDAWGLAVYSSKIWAQVRSTPDELQDMPVELAVDHAARNLRGPDVDFYREHSAKNILRIIRNRRQRDHAAARGVAC